MEINIKEFESAKQASEYIGAEHGSIVYTCAKSKNKQHKNFKFKYL